METHKIHLLLLFLSFIFAIIVLVDGFTNFSLAFSDFPSTASGNTARTDMLLYEIVVPMLSVAGLTLHVFSLHLDLISDQPETSTEALLITIGTALHGLAWLTMGGIWTACEVGTLAVRTQSPSTPGPSILVHRFGPAYCPQHSLVDQGYSVEGPIPMVKIALAWTLFVLTLASLACACRGVFHAKYDLYEEENMRSQQAGVVFEMTSFKDKETTVRVIEGYETKV